MSCLRYVRVAPLSDTAFVTPHLMRLGFTLTWRWRMTLAPPHPFISRSPYMPVEQPHPDQEPGPIGERARAWIEANPEAMTLMERYALVAKAAGRRVGARLLVERVRWELMVETRGSKFRINNNVAPYVARALIEKHPDLESVLELRELRSA